MDRLLKSSLLLLSFLKLLISIRSLTVDQLLHLALVKMYHLLRFVMNQLGPIPTDTSKETL